MVSQYQRVAGEANFPSLQMCVARGMPLNPARFSTKDESGDFAKVQRCYLTKIFWDYCNCGMVFKVKLWL